jgi:Kef-type K+ transport system membrane component KefB
VNATPMSRSNRGSRGPDSWGQAIPKAALIVVLAWAGFLFVPNKLLAFLTTRVTPHARDALVTLFVIVFFVALSWLFVALQNQRRR